MLNISIINANGVCRYFEDRTAGNRYTCELQAQTYVNEVLSIAGDHLSGKTDDDVVAVTTVNSSIPSLDNSIVLTFGNLEYLHLESTNIQIFTNDAFAGRHLNSISLQNNPLLSIPSVPFPRTLEFLWLTNTNSSLLTETSFEGLTSLTTLYLNHNRQLQLPRNIFRPLTSLTFLYLNNCELKTLDGSTFENNFGLQYLFLENNELVELPEGIFRSLSILRTNFNLSNNKIRRLNANSFGNHQKILRLSLQNNALDEIEPKFFRTFPNLRYFEAFGNICINKNLELSQNKIDFDSSEALEECRLNWETPRTTQLTTSTTNSGSKLQGMIFVYIFIISITQLIA